MRLRAAIATAGSLCLLAAAGHAAPAVAAAARPPLTRPALWSGEGASAATLLAGGRAAGAETLFVKAVDGSTAVAGYTPALIAELTAAGVAVCPWVFAYGLQPSSEAAADALAAKSSSGCLVVDAEGQYDGLYGAAQTFVRDLRTALGADFPIALSGQAETLQHPTFPYSVLLGPGGFQYSMPQVYWRALGLPVETALARAFAQNAIYGRPVLPVGQLFEAPTPTEVETFRSLSAAYGASGSSFFDLEGAEPTGLASLAVTAPHLDRHTLPFAVLHAGADGDEILWAQELLNGAGAHLPVGGYFGAQTAHALAAFQAHWHLPASGLLTARTWRALLAHSHAREPSWAKGPPLSAHLP